MWTVNHLLANTIVYNVGFDPKMWVKNKPKIAGDWDFVLYLSNFPEKLDVWRVSSGNLGHKLLLNWEPIIVVYSDRGKQNTISNNWLNINVILI